MILVYVIMSLYNLCILCCKLRECSRMVMRFHQAGSPWRDLEWWDEMRTDIIKIWITACLFISFLSSWLLRASGGPFLYKKKEPLRSTDFRLAKYLSLERQRFITFEKEENFLIPDVRLSKLRSRRRMSFFMQHVVIIFRLLLLYVHLFLTQPLYSAHLGALWNKQIWKKMGSIQVNFRFLMISGKIVRIGTHGWWW